MGLCELCEAAEGLVWRAGGVSANNFEVERQAMRRKPSVGQLLCVY